MTEAEPEIVDLKIPEVEIQTVEILQNEEDAVTLQVEEAEPAQFFNPNDLAPSGNPIYVVMKCEIDRVEKLTSMGYSLVAAEKALYYSDGHTVESALLYLEKNELSDKLNVPVKVLQPSTMTEEEKMKKAAALQKALREKIRVREAEELREKEKARREINRGSAEAKLLIEESDRKRQIMIREREKDIDQKWHDELRIKQINDYRERFGEDPPEDYFEVKKEDQKARVTELVMSLQREMIYTNPEGLKACFTMLLAYMKNLEKDPLNEKFRQIRMSNKHFKEKVGPYEQAVDILMLVGFEKKIVSDDDYLVIDELPRYTMGSAIKYIDLLLKRL